MPDTDNRSDRKPAQIKLPLAIAFLGWMAVVFGVYFCKMLTLPGRLEKLIGLLQSFLP